MPAVITITAGTIPPPACWGSGPTDENLRLQAFVAAMTATLTSPAEWVVQQPIPDVSDTGKLWLQLDGDGLPLMAYRYIGGTWVRWFGLSVFQVSTGAAGAYSITNSPPYTTTGAAYRTGQQYRFKANHATTGASTLDVDGLGAKAIKVKVTDATVLGSIKIDQMVTVEYDGVNFQMISAQSAVAIAPSDITSGGIDRQFLRTVLISTGPDVFQTQWETSLYKTLEAAAVAIPAGGTPATFAHGLGQRPAFHGMAIILTDAGGDLGYSQGTEIQLGNTSQIDPGLSDDNAPTVWADATEIGFQSMVGSTPIRISDKATGAVTAIDPTKWKLVAWAMK